VGSPKVFAWGDNGLGQVAPIAAPTSGAKVVVPTEVHGLPANIVALAAGNSHSLALDDQGNVWAWGANGCGELGVAPYDAATDTSCFWDESTPHGKSTCVSGTCDGPGGGGSCNTDADCPGASPFQSTPGKVPLPRPAVAIAAGFMVSVALLDDGTVMTWGYNISGTLGTGSNNYVANPTPQRVLMNGAPLSGVRSIHAGDGHIIAVTDQGVLGWGSNYSGQLAADDQGYGLNNPYPVPPISIPIPAGATSLTTGSLHTYYIDDGSLWGFGSYWNAGGNNFGWLTSSRTPMEILGPSQLGTSKIREVSSGGYFGIALGDDGRVWFFGDAEANVGGQIPGPGPTTIQGLPSDVTDVWAGDLTAYARDTAGQIWSFGYDDQGELGVATPPANGGPVQIPTITGVTLFSTSSDFALALGYACAPTTTPLSANITSPLPEQIVTFDGDDCLPPTADSITGSAMGGTAPYTYSWAVSLLGADGTVLAGPEGISTSSTAQTSAIPGSWLVQNLDWTLAQSSGEEVVFTLTVTDATGAQVTASETVDWICGPS
jgi:YD repeat-containing protein